MKCRIITTILCGTALWLSAGAAETSPAYNFLNVPSSTLSYGLGGLNISTVDDDVMNIDVNPALLGPEMGRVVGVNYMRYMGSSNFAGAKFASGINERSAWGVGIQYYGYGSMKATDETGTIIGDFSPKDVAFSGYYSHDIYGGLRGGVAVKVLYSSYEAYSAVALATDLGINYYDPEKDLSLSLVVANLGGQVKRFTDSYDRLPIDVRIGWTQSFGSFPVRFSITAWNLTQWKLPYYDNGDGSAGSTPKLKESFISNLFRHLIFAADFVPNERFHIGIGYNHKVKTDMSTWSRNFLSGFSLGAGLNVGRVGVGAAISAHHSGALTFMFNMSFLFSELMK